MAISAFLFNSALKNAFSGNVNLLSLNNVKIMLLDNSIAPSQSTWEFADIITNEISSAEYTPGGAVLQNVILNTINSKFTIDADDVVWSGASFTARYAVIYQDTGVPSTSPLISYIDFGNDISVVGDDFKIFFDIMGIITIDVLQSPV